MWKNILIVVVMPLIVTVVGGVALNYLQSRTPELVYSIQQTIPFQGDKETISVQNIYFANLGNYQAQNVIARIEVENATIRERKIKVDPSLRFSEKLERDAFSLDIATLNPKEKIEISLLLATRGDTGQRVKVYLRGDGVLGQELSNKLDDEAFSLMGLPWYLILLIVYLSIGAVFASSPIGRRLVISTAKFSMGMDFLSQRDVFGMYFALYGDENEAEHYLRGKGPCSYRSEAELISTRAINTTSLDKKRIYLSVLCDVAEARKGMMREASLAVVYYNIARIFKHLNDASQTDVYLNKAKDIDADHVTLRLAKDVVFSS